MPLARRDVLRVHARAFNAHDLPIGDYVEAAMFRDGEWIGEGPEAVQKGLEAEWNDAVARVVDLDGEPALVNFSGDEGRGAPSGIVRLEVEDGRVTACRIDHDPALLERVR